MITLNMEEKKTPKKALILGGGFAGVYSFLSLNKEFKAEELEITLVNQNNYFLFSPLLHEAATGGIGTHQPVESLREIIHRRPGSNFHVGTVKEIDLARQVVKTTVGELAYDILIIALGARTAFYNIPGAQEYSLMLKDLADAVKLRNHLLNTFEKAAEEKDIAKRRELLTISVIGGGPTGVELAAEIAELVLTTIRRYYSHMGPCDVTINLLSKSSELIQQFKPRSRQFALRSLEKLGVKVMTDAVVVRVEKNKIILARGDEIHSNTVIWVAGVKAQSITTTPVLPYDVNHRIQTDQFLLVDGYNNVFALGDIASTAGESLPMLAQVAVEQGREMGRLARASLTHQPTSPFIYKSKGELVSLGQWRATGNVHGLHINGMFTWLLWRAVYWSKFISGTKQLKIALDWLIYFFHPRDISKT